MIKDKRTIGTAAATAVGLGAIIGAGIFVLSGTAIALAGAYALIAFVLVGIVAFIVALEFGELGSRMPNLKGGSYSYVHEAFGSELGFVTGMLSYFTSATSVSVVALGFGSYLSTMLNLGTSYHIIFAITIIVILSIVNIFGIKKAAKLDFGLVVIKLLILLLFVIFAVFVTLGMSHLSTSNFSVPGGSAVNNIFAASVIIFFAYSGFGTISTIFSKIKGGNKSAAKAIWGSVLISIIIYTLVVFSLMLLVPASLYKISADPLAFALQKAAAPQYLFTIVDIGALIATASATVAMILGSSRVLYQMSEDRLLPAFLRKYDKKRDAAVNGVVVSAMIAIAMLFSGNIYIIASISNFGLLLSYLMVSFALIHFRRDKVITRKKNNMDEQFRVPLYPYLPIIAIIALFAFLIGLPKSALLVGLILMIALIIIYYSLREIEKKRIIKVSLFD